MRVNVWNYLWRHVLKRSPGINRKSRVSYPAPGFLSSATSCYKGHCDLRNYEPLQLSIKQRTYTLAELLRESYLSYLGERDTYEKYKCKVSIIPHTR